MDHPDPEKEEEKQNYLCLHSKFKTSKYGAQFLMVGVLENLKRLEEAREHDLKLKLDEASLK